MLLRNLSSADSESPVTELDKDGDVLPEF